MNGSFQRRAGTVFVVSWLAGSWAFAQPARVPVAPAPTIIGASPTVMPTAPPTRPRPSVTSLLPGVVGAPVLPGAAVQVRPAPGSAVTPPPGNAAPACVPLRHERILGLPALQAWTLAAINDRSCAAPTYAGRTSTAHELIVIEVPSRVAVALTTDRGGLEISAQGRNGPVLTTTAGLCGPGSSTGVAVLEPGQHVLRAVGGDGNAPRSVQVEAIAVPAGLAPAERPGTGRVVLNPATTQPPPYDCRNSDGVVVRLLACPGSRASMAAFTAEQGALVSIESATAARVCITVPAGQRPTTPLPGGRLVVLRAWPLGTGRGPVAIDLL